MGRGMHGNNKRGRGYSYRRISIFCCRLIQGFLPLKEKLYGSSPIQKVLKQNVDRIVDLLLPVL